MPAELSAAGISAGLVMWRRLDWPFPAVQATAGPSEASRRQAGVRRESLTATLLARRPCGSRPASGRQTPIFSTSTFQIAAMLWRVSWRTSPRVSVYCTSGSPSFSCSTTSSTSRLVASLEPGLLPEEFCTGARRVIAQRHREHCTGFNCQPPLLELPDCILGVPKPEPKHRFDGVLLDAAPQARRLPEAVQATPGHDTKEYAHKPAGAQLHICRHMLPMQHLLCSLALPFGWREGVKAGIMGQKQHLAVNLMSMLGCLQGPLQLLLLQLQRRDPPRQLLYLPLRQLLLLLQVPRRPLRLCWLLIPVSFRTQVSLHELAI